MIKEYKKGQNYLFDFQSDAEILFLKIIDQVFEENKLRFELIEKEKDVDFVDVFLDLERCELFFYRKNDLHRSLLFIETVPCECFVDFNNDKNKMELLRSKLKFAIFSEELQNNFWKELHELSSSCYSNTTWSLDLESVKINPISLKLLFNSNSVMKDYIFEAFNFKVLTMDEMFVKSNPKKIAQYFEKMEELYPEKVNELSELRIRCLINYLKENPFAPNDFDRLFVDLYYSFQDEENKLNLLDLFDSFVNEVDLKLISIDFIYRTLKVNGVLFPETVKAKLLEKINDDKIKVSKKSFPTSIRWMNDHDFEMVLDFMKKKKAEVSLELDKEDKFPFTNGFLGQDCDEDEEDEFFDATPQFILKDELLFLSRLKQIKDVSKENNLSVINLEEILSHTTEQIKLNK